MRYTAHVRAVVLDGAVPLGMRFPDSTSDDAQRALEALLAACDLDAFCHAAYPRARNEIVSLLRTSAAGERVVTLRHPRTNRTISMSLSRDALTEVVRAALYSPVMAARLPALVREATAGDFAPLMAQWFEMASATTDTMALGATMSILCSEDVDSSAGPAAPPAATLFAGSCASFWRSRCRHWPPGPPFTARDLPRLDVPALILSGGLDPVTPPRWGEEMSRAFTRHAHVVVPGAAHNTSFTGCVPDIIAAFVASAAPENARRTLCGRRCASTLRREHHGNPAMMQVSGIRKTHGDIVAVDGVSFAAENGKVTGVLGPNGAGKTTTIRTLLALVKPAAGSASVDGIDVLRHPREARRRLGGLPESAGLYPRLTVREQLAFAAALHGLAPSERAARVDLVLGQLSLVPLASRLAGTLSLGQRRRVLLAAALVHDPPNLVLDKPTNGLDVVGARQVRAQIRRLADAGRTVILSSHVMPEVAAVCDRIVILSKGAVVAAGTPADIQANAQAATLEDAFVRVIGSEEGLN